MLATLFVNPLQFGPKEDLSRYPRTFEADLALLSRAGADAVYAPDPTDLYPPGFATYVVPEGPAAGYEGAARPGHFRGVATVVHLLLQRARPDRAYFGRRTRSSSRCSAGWPWTWAPRGGDRLPHGPREGRSGPLLPKPVPFREERGRRSASPGRWRPWWRAPPPRERVRRRCRRRARARLAAAGLAADYLDVVDPETLKPVESSGPARPGNRHGSRRDDAPPGQPLPLRGARSGPARARPVRRAPAPLLAGLLLAGLLPARSARPGADDPQSTPVRAGSSEPRHLRARRRPRAGPRRGIRTR